MPVYAQQYPVYQPSMRIITAITNALNAQVTTSFPHQYITGSIMRLDLPQGYGMQQANGQQCEITVNSPTTFLTGIDTTQYDPFIPIPVLVINKAQQAQVVNVGENNNMLTAAQMNVLPYTAT